jgi:hypothetical protein
MNAGGLLPTPGCSDFASCLCPSLQLLYHLAWLGTDKTKFQGCLISRTFFSQHAWRICLIILFSTKYRTETLSLSLSKIEVPAMLTAITTSPDCGSARRATEDIHERAKEQPSDHRPPNSWLHIRYMGYRIVSYAKLFSQRRIFVLPATFEQ